MHSQSTALSMPSSADEIASFNTWYTDQQLEEIVYYRKSEDEKSSALKYVALDSSQSVDYAFHKQIETLIYLKKRLKASHVCFVSLEPGHQSHFIAGVLYGENNLLIINSIGNSSHHGLYKALIKTQQKCHLNILLSSTPIQQDPEHIVSCGPIAAEITRHLALMDASVIESIINTLPKVSNTKIRKIVTTLSNQSHSDFLTIDIDNSDLLSFRLQRLKNSTPEDYIRRMLKLRKKHAQMCQRHKEGMDHDEYITRHLLTDADLITHLHEDPKFINLKIRFELQSIDHQTNRSVSLSTYSDNQIKQRLRPYPILFTNEAKETTHSTAIPSYTRDPELNSVELSFSKRKAVKSHNLFEKEPLLKTEQNLDEKPDEKKCFPCCNIL